MKHSKLPVLLLIVIMLFNISLGYAEPDPNTGQSIEINEDNPERIIDFEIEIPIEGKVIINYLDEQEKAIANQEVYVVEGGEHTYKAKDIKGYILTNESPQTIEIKDNGEVKTINFNYRKAKGTVTIDYLDGNVKLQDTDEYIVELGEHTYNAKSFEGYKLSSEASKTVSIISDGEVKNIAFNYNKIIIQPEPTPEPEPEPIIEPTVEEPEPIPEPEPEIVLGTVKGQIVTIDEEPLKGLKIELHSNPMITYTDENGYFEFTDVELGEHTLYLSSENNSDILSELSEIKVKVDELENTISNQIIVSSIGEGKLIEISKLELTEEKPDKTALLVAALPIPEPEKTIPIIPIVAVVAGAIILLIAFRRKNLVIYEIENNSIVTKMRITAKPTVKIKLDKALKLAGNDNIKLVFNRNISKRLTESEIILLNAKEIIGVYKVPEEITGALEIELQEVLG